VGLGVTLRVALYAHTALALATGPVSAAIANASFFIAMGFKPIAIAKFFF